MNQDNLVWIAVAGMMIVSVGLGNPKVQSVLGTITESLKGFFSRKAPVDNSTLVEPSTHEIVELLLANAEDDGDTEGVMLLSAYGKHLYDRRVKNG